MKHDFTHERMRLPQGIRWQPPASSLIGIVLLTAFMGQNTSAQTGGNYRLDWSTIDAGGGTSRGGSFTVSGTIGQPDAGALQGGAYKLEGGFWHGLSVVQVPGAPILTIRLLGNGQAVLSWPVGVTDFVLEETGALNAAWTTVLRLVVDTATEHTVTVPASAPIRCYRLKKTQP